MRLFVTIKCEVMVISAVEGFPVKKRTNLTVLTWEHAFLYSD